MTKIISNFSTSLSLTKQFLAHTEPIKNQFYEFLMVMYLDQNGQLIHKQSIKIGKSQIDIKDIFHPALIYECYGIVLAHNHPSGKCYPSKKDLYFTKKVKRVGKILDIPIIDHLIVTGSDYFSFLASGLI